MVPAILVNVVGRLLDILRNRETCSVGLIEVRVNGSGAYLPPHYCPNHRHACPFVSGL